MGAHRTGDGWARDLTAAEAYEQRVEERSSILNRITNITRVLGSSDPRPGAPRTSALRNECAILQDQVAELDVLIATYEAAHKEEE